MAFLSSGCSLSRAYEQIDGDGHAIYRFKAIRSVSVKEGTVECNGFVKRLSSGQEKQSQTARLRCSDGRSGQLTMELDFPAMVPETMEGTLGGQRVQYVETGVECVNWPKEFRCN